MKNHLHWLKRLLIASSFLFLAVTANAQAPAWMVNKVEPLYSDPATSGVYDTDLKISVSLSTTGKVYFITYSTPPASNPSATSIIKYCRGTLALPPNVVKTDSIQIPVDSTTYTYTLENASMQRSAYTTSMAAISTSGVVSATTKNFKTYLCSR